MAGGTRGHLDLKPLREFVGNSKPLPQTELPTLRDILAAGILEKESLSHSQEISKKEFSLRLARQILSVYHKANSDLKPGLTLVREDSIAKRLERRWADAVQLANRRGSKMAMKREQ